MRLKYYAKIRQGISEADLRDAFVSAGAEEDDIIIDETARQKQPGSVYSDVKRLLLESGDSLTIDSLISIGKNQRELDNEISWFVENQVRLIVLDLPATKQESVSPLLAMKELLDYQAKREADRVKEAQRTGIEDARTRGQHFGRKRIAYPPNWHELYRKWKTGEINSVEFLKASGLKKGTFYNMLRMYKEENKPEENDIKREA